MHLKGQISLQKVAGWDMGISLFEPKEIDGLRLPPDKASTVMTAHGKVVQVESYIQKP